MDMLTALVLLLPSVFGSPIWRVTDPTLEVCSCSLL